MEIKLDFGLPSKKKFPLNKVILEGGVVVGYLSSSIGRKQLMGLSGLVLTGFVAGHMAGNLSIFGGPEIYNSYGHAIVSNKVLLYTTEVVLILAFLAHVVLGILLTRQNKRARHQKYARTTHGAKAAEFASKSMVYHGVALLGFVIWHLYTFKFGEYYEVTYAGVPMRDLFSLLVEKFNQPFYLIAYGVLMLTVGVHLSHGFSSSFQSLGFHHPRYSPLIRRASIAFAIIVGAGFLSQPIYIFLFY